MAYDATKYIYQGQRAPLPDFASGFHKLAQMKMQQAKLQESARQADQSQANIMARHQVDSTRLENQRQDVNKRFNVELSDKQDARATKYSREDQDKVQAMVMKQGDMVAQGNYRGALALAPTMKSMGIDVQTTANEDGTFDFNVTAPTFGDKPGPLNPAQQEPSQPAEQAPQQPQAQPQGEQPVERDAFGAQRFTPEQLTLDSGPIPAQMPTAGAPAPDVQATQGAPGGQPVAGGQPLDPSNINTGMLEQVTRRRLDPIMKGVVGSYPGRFQGRIGGLTQGFSETGLPADKVLDMMKAPQAQATGLMKSELGAEASGLRARMSQHGQGFSEEFKREDKAYQNMHRDAKENGVKESILVVQDVDRIKNDLVSRNGVKVYAALKDLMLMKEKRLTDKDMEGGTYGLISNMDKLKEVGHRVVATASPEMKRKWVDWAESVGEVQRKKVAIGVDSLVSQAAEYRYDAGRAGSERFLGELPQEYVQGAVQRYNETRTKKASKPTPTSKSESSSVSISTSGKADKSHVDKYSDFL